MKLSTARADDVEDCVASIPVRGKVVRIEEDGSIIVESLNGRVLRCECLYPIGIPKSLIQADDIRAGQSVLVLPPQGEHAAVVLGRVGPIGGKNFERNVAFAATDRIVLRCGEASLELRADGKVLIKGEDVTVRAKGTQRIRAGTVSIN